MKWKGGRSKVIWHEVRMRNNSTVNSVAPLWIRRALDEENIVLIGVERLPSEGGLARDLGYRPQDERFHDCRVHFISTDYLRQLTQEEQGAEKKLEISFPPLFFSNLSQS
jgi:hypothetical protein